MRNTGGPTWLGSGRRYYSQIERESTDPVTVFSAGDKDVSNEKPGTPVVHLEPGSGFVRVLDADKKERGTIRSERLMPVGQARDALGHGGPLGVVGAVGRSEASHVPPDSRGPVDLRHSIPLVAFACHQGARLSANR